MFYQTNHTQAAERAKMPFFVSGHLDLSSFFLKTETDGGKNRTFHRSLRVVTKIVHKYKYKTI